MNTYKVMKLTFGKKMVVSCVVLIIILFLVELSLCNSNKYEVRTFPSNQLYTEFGEIRGGVDETGSFLVANNQDVHLCLDINDKTETVKFIYSSPSVIEGDIYIKDEAQQHSWKYGTTFLLDAGEETSYIMELVSQGECKSIKLHFINNNTSFHIKEIIINENKEFNIHRFFIEIVLVVVGVFLFNLRHINWDADRDTGLKRYLPFFAGGVVLIASSIIVWWMCTGGEISDIPYNMRNFQNNNAYLYMFDSFEKGISYLDIEPDPNMANLRNIYDRSERQLKGISYKWDYAYTNGRYYSYYGVTPLFIVYLPYYFVTHMLPNDYMAGLILSILFNIVLVILIYEALRQNHIKCSIVSILLCIIACGYGSLIFSAQSCADMYYNLNACTMLFEAVFLLSAIKATTIAEGKLHYGAWVLNGLSIVALVECRPNALIPVFLVMLPRYFKCIKRCIRNKSEFRKFVPIIMSLTIVAVGGVLVCRYNYERFGSIFDFGKSYQLTAYDPNYYHVQFSIKTIIGTIYYYLLEVPIFNIRFPFITLNNTPVDGAGYYLLKDPNMGILFIPLIWGIFLYYEYRRNILSKKAEVLMLIGCFICMYLDYCMGGAQIRYHMDYILLPLLFAIGLMLYAEKSYLNSTGERIENNRLQGSMIFTRNMVLFCLTIIVGTMLIFNNQRSTIRNLNPYVFSIIKNVFTL